MFGWLPVHRAGLGSGAAAHWQRAMAGLRRPAARRPVPAARQLRPAVVPGSLDDLRGPASGVVELPVRLYWSGSRRFDLADPHQAADLCEAVLDAAATAGDISGWLNADLLIRAWPVLGMSRAKRDAWESRFPVLRSRRLAPAA